MTDLLMSIPDAFIAIFAIFVTFLIPILAIYFSHQNRNKIMEERRLMIEKGIAPPPLSTGFENFQSKNNLYKGLKLIAIALGLLAGYFISMYMHIRFAFGIVGSILFFLGLVNIIISLSSEERKNNSPLNDSDNEKQ